MSMMDRSFAADATAPIEIGRILEVAGVGARATLDAATMAALDDDGPDHPGAIGSYLKLRLARRWIVAQVRTLRLAEVGGELIFADLDFVGEARIDGARMTGFTRGVSHMPLPGARLHPTTREDREAIFASDDRAHITFGKVHPGDGARAALYVDALLSRHFAILGSTGTGKSSATALLLHRICEAAPHAHILMIDPHGEYGASFATTGAVFDVTNLALPFWLMNLEEHAEIFVTARGPDRQTDIDIFARALLAARAKNRAAEGVQRLTADSPIPYLLSDLANILNMEMGKLDKGGIGVTPYLRLKARIDELKVDPRYAFMFSGMLAGDTMHQVMARLLRLPADGKPIAIVDLSAVPSEITPVLVALLARLTFDHALWARGKDERPVLLVCEEAHRYIPTDTHTPARRILERIAKEGRKYGVALGLVSQRPSDLAEGVLSQCGTIIAMRLNNDKDQAHVRAAVPEGARGLIEAIPALRNREGIVVGEGVALPIRAIFDNLEAEKLPASRDPSFAQSWAEAPDEPQRLTRTILRWRAQGRLNAAE